MPFRDSISAISPPWLLERIAGGIQYAFGAVLDAVGEWEIEGNKARFPDFAPSDGLGHIGNDRMIDRGPTEEDDTYRTRLREGVQTWHTAGNAFTLLEQLAVFWLPLSPPTIRLVSNSAVWHELSGGTITKTVGSNWNWDGLGRWWRGWVIIDGSSTWTLDLWGDPGNWGDGGVWGSDMTSEDWITLVSITRKWKPAHVAAQFIIIFDPTLFEVTDSAPPNPNGNYDDPAVRALVEANFYEEIT